MALEPKRPVKGQQEEQPERAGEVPHDPQQQMQPADTPEPAREENHAVLQVALAPTPVSFRVLDGSLRRLFVAAFKVLCHPDLPILPDQQGSLYEVVAKDLPAERPDPR